MKDEEYLDKLQAISGQLTWFSETMKPVPPEAIARFQQRTFSIFDNPVEVINALHLALREDPIFQGKLSKIHSITAFPIPWNWSGLPSFDRGRYSNRYRVFFFLKMPNGSKLKSN